MDGFDESSQEESEICDGRHFAAKLWNFNGYTSFCDEFYILNKSNFIKINF